MCSRQALKHLFYCPCRVYSEIEVATRSRGGQKLISGGGRGNEVASTLGRFILLAKQLCYEKQCDKNPLRALILVLNLATISSLDGKGN